MTNIRATRFVLATALAGTMLLSAQAHALAYVGTFATDAVNGRYSLITEGGTPTPTNGADDWLRFLPANQPFFFDITGNVLTAGGSQTFSLQSNNGAVAEFVLTDLMLDLSGPNNLAGGFMDYTLDGVAGTFLFVEQLYGSSGFNTSSFSGTTFNALIWGGDSANGLGFDGGITGRPVPLPGAILLFGSALAGLGLRRRKA